MTYLKNPKLTPIMMTPQKAQIQIVQFFALNRNYKTLRSFRGLEQLTISIRCLVMTEQNLPKLAKCGTERVKALGYGNISRLLVGGQN